MITAKKLGTSLYKAAYWTIQHDGIEHAGYLAFLTWLSFFPFMVLLVALTGAFGQSQLGTEFVNLFINELPQQFISVFKLRIDEIVSGPPASLQTISILSMIWTASAAVEGLRTILNRAYRVQTPPSYIWRRLTSIVQFLVIMAMILAAMVILILLPVTLGHLQSLLELESTIMDEWVYIRYGLSATMVFFAVGASYYVLPNIKQRWSHVWPGTALVMVLWVLAAAVFSLYLNNFQQVNLVYGSLEGIIITLLLFYILGVIYIFGAEFNYFIEQALGNKVEQKERVLKPRKKKSAPKRK